VPTSLKTLLVTGAYGFVGANVCKYFLNKGWQVVAVEGPQRLDWRLSPQPQLRAVQVDITDAAAVAQLLQDTQPHCVVNAAAYGAYASQTCAERIYAVNCDGVRHLLEAAQDLPGLQAFVQLGSSSEYGANCAAPGEEAATWPDSHYAVSKVSASALVRMYALKHAVPAFVLRLYSVYGPYEDTSRLIPRLLQEAQVGKLPPLVHPNIARDFVYVEDVCRAIEQVVARAASLKKGDYFNIGSGVCTRLADLVDTACKTFALQARPSWGSMPARHWDHANWCANPAHAKQHLLWQAQTGLRDGLLQTMQWMQHNAALLPTAVAHSVLNASAPN
jgi:nucleoside-diphosphate-sugar epimerase